MDGVRVNSVGFFIGRESFYWVILESHSDERIELKSIEKIPFPEPLDLNNYISQNNRLKIFNTLQKFPQEYLEGKRINLAIDSTLSYIVKLPVEKSLHPEELKDHLIWEFSQHYYNEKPEDYSIAFHPIILKSNKSFDSIIFLSIQKVILNFFKYLFEDSGIKLKVTDVDHFSAETLCRAVYPEFSYSNNFLVSFKSNFFELSLIQSGILVNYRKVTFNVQEEILNYFEKDLVPVIKSMKTKIGKIYIWGENLKNRLVEELNSIIPVEVIMINPFKNFIINKYVLNSPVYENFHEFTAACGIALRR
jgi:Tfp pilus assembly PilM family ATPase